MKAFSSEIYCYGELLKTVQLANIYPDSKTFVDMHQKDDPSVTLKKFETLMEETGRNPNREQIQQFVDDAFDSNDILEYHTPSDWTDHPSVLQQVVDSNYRRWVLDLNEIWKNLTRRMQDSIKEHPERHSIIYVPNPFVIPGGRFKEFYYWDTYWIVQGLLLCDMTETTRGIIENFLSVVATYGHIPNGGRVYYIQRSQPPMLTPMVDSYYERTKNLTFIKNNIDLLEKEFDFWLKERLTTVEKDGKQYTLARYYAPSQGPRPESFRTIGIYIKNNVSYYAKRSVEYISNESIRNYLGGIPASLELSNEQWDFPNAWPPLQSIAIQGLAYTNDEVAKNLAFELANNWVKSNYKGFEDSKAMFEKYDAQHPGKYGGGGEYVVQSGFGWTNGVILEFLNTYGKEMNSKSVHNVRSEDYRHAESIPNEEEKTQFYINIKSAAESGWDFSSRWFIYQGTNGGNLTHINTQNIIPVDLNAFIYWNAVLLAKFNTLLGNTMIAQDYMSVAEEIKAGVAAVLWNEEWGTWLDYDMINNKPREYFYPSNLAPLWTYCYDLVCI
ncbi:hypothetical protein C0J52_14170 [Blattella germanica]|nr:hypothetical protein C0J52_14170 [Blattella germanica]